MAVWNFTETDVANAMNFGMVSMTLAGNASQTIFNGSHRVISMLCNQTWIFGATLCPFGPYTPANNDIFPGGRGRFTGTSDAEFLTLIGSNPHIGSIAGPAGLGCVLTFNWQQNISTEPRAEDAHKLILTKLSKLDTKALKESIKVLEDAKIRHSDNAEVHPPGIL